MGPGATCYQQDFFIDAHERKRLNNSIKCLIAQLADGV